MRLTWAELLEGEGQHREGKEYPVSQMSEAPPGRQVHLMSSEDIELRVDCWESEVPSFETYGAWWTS